MSGHTPGPWSVSGGFGIYADQKPTAFVHSGPGEKANARLIAAAPELLEALKNLVSQVDENSWIRDELAEARAAIAKAEGKQ